MNELRRRIEAEVRAVVSQPSVLEDVYRRVERRRWKRRAVAMATGLVVTVGLFAGLRATFGGGVSHVPVGTGTVLLGGKTMSATEAAGSAWIVTRSGTKEGTLTRIDAGSGQILATIDVTSPSGVTGGDDSVWVISFWDSTVSRIDPATNEVIATIPLSLPWEVTPGDDRFLPIDIAVGEGAVWVSTARGAVARIDPATNEVVGIITLPRESTGQLAAGDGAVWVSESLDGVYRIDPSTNEVVDKVLVDDKSTRLSVNDIEVTEAGVWASGGLASPIVDEAGNPDYELTGDTAVVEINPQQDQVGRPILSSGGADLLVGSGQLWVISQNGHVAKRVDTVRGQFGAAVQAPSGHRFVAVAGAALWATTADGNLVRVPAASG